MFNSKTVFILGAGASHEFGLPLGTELAKRILQMMPHVNQFGQMEGSYDKELFASILEEQTSAYDILQAATRIRQGIPLRNSIDDFLDLNLNHKAIMQLGKAAIVKAIAEAEQKSNLGKAVDPATGSVDFSKLNSNWLLKFVRMLRQTGPDLLLDNVAFVSFNYDRSLELFLFSALQTLYSFSASEASNFVNKIAIVHPYGTIGKLKELGGTFSFGGMLPSGAVGSLAKYSVMRANDIKTYSEETAQLPIEKEIDSCFNRAANVIFLGFGFHKQNLSLISKNFKRSATRVFATACGIALIDQPALSRAIGTMFSDNDIRGGLLSMRTSISEATCDKFFDEYAFTLREL